MYIRTTYLFLTLVDGFRIIPEALITSWSGPKDGKGTRGGIWIFHWTAIPRAKSLNILWADGQTMPMVCIYSFLPRNWTSVYHQSWSWHIFATAPNIEYVGRYGDSILYRDLPSDLKTDPIAQYFGAISDTLLEGRIVVCGSVGEGEILWYIQTRWQRLAQPWFMFHSLQRSIL